jgi:hypothetical protein
VGKRQYYLKQTAIQKTNALPALKNNGLYRHIFQPGLSWP